MSPQSNGAAPKIDHFAISVSDFEEQVASLLATGWFRLIREGTRPKDGSRIALIGDGTGMKIELMESVEEGVSFGHVAVRVDNVESAGAHLRESGWLVDAPPHALPAAHAQTNLTENQAKHPIGLQIIAYEPESPDIVRWNDE